MKVCFLTLGCKVNQQETAAMIEIFKNNGCSIAKDSEVADVYIVNSCTVTLSGDKKSIQWINKKRNENKDSVIVLCGCMPQAFPQKAMEVNNADIIIGTKNKGEIYNLVTEFIKTKKRHIDIPSYDELNSFEELPLAKDSLHTRAFLKVQDGCSRNCAFCIIPKARGKVRSRTIENIRQQAEKLALSHNEIVLTGVNISCYGQDLGNNICDVVENLSEIEGIERIRIGSLEIDLFTDEMLYRLSKLEKFCAHFHLSLQSGCDKTLKEMNRLYDTEFFSKKLAVINEYFTKPSFTTDIIVGFPNESEEDFLQSVRYMQKCQFLKVHVFSYSKREGTTAFSMDNQIPENIKQDRNKTMTFKSNQVRQKIMQDFIGFHDNVLLEKKTKDGYFTGYTTRYIPVLLKDTGYKKGEIVNIELIGIQGDKMIAKPL